MARGARPLDREDGPFVRRHIALLVRWRRRPHWTVVAVAAFVLVYASWQVVHWGPSGQQQLLSNLFFWPLDVVGVIACWCASRRTTAMPRLARAWLLMTLATSTNLVGDLVYTGYEWAGAYHYPSPADAIYLSFYPLMLAALFAFPMVARGGDRLRFALDLVVVALGGSAAEIMLVLGPTALADNGNLLSSIVTVAYPVGDLVLLVGLSALLLRGSLPSLRRPQQLLAAALGLYVLADLVYGYQTLHAGYVDGSWVDSLWLGAIVLFAAAGASQPRLAVPEKIEAAPERISWLPFLGLTVGFVVLLAADREASFFPDRFMTVVAVVLSLLVALRQFLAQRDLLRAHYRMGFQALHDGLTGLPNRTLLHDRLEHALAQATRRRHQLAVLLLDVDDFKLVNDTLGHDAGDELLVELANRLRVTARSGETVARLGGDEFVLVCEGVLDTRGLALLAERLFDDCFRDPFELGGVSRDLRGSIGVGVAQPGDAASAVTLLRDADTAMYRAKASAHSRFELYDADLRSELLRQVGVRQALTEALARGTLGLVYQPIVGPDGRGPLACEALLRWHDRRFGDVSPAEFVPLAEQSGQIVPLGRSTLARACAQLSRWRAADPTALPLGVFLNTAPRELVETDYCAFLLTTLAAHGLTPADVALELTERVFIDEQDGPLARTLTDLGEAGVRLVLDDFGTGYSALASLKRFPLYAVKIDRYFTETILEDTAGAEVTRAIVALGHALGMLVIGEGVETQAQLDSLGRLGCDAVQGFLTGPPDRPSALSAHLGPAGTERCAEGFYRTSPVSGSVKPRNTALVRGTPS